MTIFGYVVEGVILVFLAYGAWATFIKPFTSKLPQEDEVDESGWPFEDCP